MTDSDWAGCRYTRRSTSGGVAMHGAHYLKHWSKNQGGVALSSAEAELYAQVKGCTEGLGMQTMFGELGVNTGIVSKTDSSAARGVILRQGTGRIKHIALNQLWIQEQASNQTLRYIKIPREANISDLMTHHWPAAHGESLMKIANLVNPGI